LLGINRTFRHPKLDNWINSESYEKPIIHVRFVTKGVNQQQAIESCMDAWNSVKNPKLWERAEWHIEVLTDN